MTGIESTIEVVWEESDYFALDKTVRILDR